jgi:hypothetical protein
MPRPKRVIKGTVPKRERYRSGFEVKVKKSLESRGIEFKYESEKLPYIVPESKHLYTPDFIVQTEVGTTIYVEAKGNFTAADRKKMKTRDRAEPGQRYSHALHEQQQDPTEL